MAMNKTTIDLDGVPQTLLLPLFGRAKFSLEGNSPFYDERAVALVQSLNYDFDQLSKRIGGFQPLWWMARAYHFDEAIKKYLKSHPNATIINLGAGLETAFFRVDNGKLNWIDLDLPDVITLREKLLPAPNRVHYIAKSIFDDSWMDDVKKFGEDYFFFAGGFFMYFTEAQVKDIFLKMAMHFPTAELIFDTISARGLKNANQMLQQAGMTNALLQWGISDSKVLENWSSKIKRLTQIPYFATIKTKFNWPLSMRLKMFFYDMVNEAGIVHLKFIQKRR